MMKDKKTIKKKSQLNFYVTNNNYNYMINDERQKKIKKKSQLNFYVLIIIIII